MYIYIYIYERSDSCKCPKNALYDFVQLNSGGV